MFGVFRSASVRVSQKRLSSQKFTIFCIISTIFLLGLQRRLLCLLTSPYSQIFKSVYTLFIKRLNKTEKLYITLINSGII